MIAVDQACQLMEQALSILDSNGVHQAAALLDSAILALPGAALTASSRPVPNCLPLDDEHQS